MRLWISLALAVGAAGCAVIWGIEDKTLVTDSGVVGADAGEGGSLPESSTGDGGDAGDAGVDAAPDPEPSLPCSQQPDSGSPVLYCNDFDVTGTIGATWDYGPLIQVDGGSLAFDTVRFKSRPRSARATAPPSANGGGVQLGKLLGTLTTDARVAFDMYIDVDETGLNNLPEIGVVQLRGDTAQIVVNYVLGSGRRARLQAWRASNDTYYPMPAPKSRTWTRIVFSYHATEGVRAWQDGAEVQEAKVPAHAFGAPGDGQVIIGQAYINGGGTTVTSIQIDNVVIRGK